MSPAAKAPRAVIEGTLVQVSTLPAAETNPYPNCYYTAIIEVNGVLSGKNIPKRVILVLPGFFDRKYAPEANFKSGDKVRATLVPFTAMPDSVRQTQQADEIEDVDLEFYFPESISSISGFQSSSNVAPLPQTAAKPRGANVVQKSASMSAGLREQQIQKDLEKINALLEKHGGDWDKWYGSLKDYRDQYRTQYEVKSQRWVGNSFFSAGEIDNGRMYSREFIDSVIALKEYLAARNVDLILVRVPRKGEIVDDLFVPPPADQVGNPYLLRMYKELLEADVEIVTDIIPKAKAARLRFPLMYWYQNFPEDHPAEGMSWVIAEELAQRINRYERVRSARKSVFTLKTGSVPSGWLRDKWPAGNPKFKSTEYTRFATVADKKGKALKLKQGLDSPILLIGSSFVAVPDLEKGASIPHYLAYQTGIAPDILHRKNADFMMPRSIAREGDAFLRNRSVCLFPFPSFIAYKPLASLPAFDSDSSSKRLIASFSGKGMQKAIEFENSGTGPALSVSEKGLLPIPPSTREKALTSRFRVKVPQDVSKYPNFVIAIEFAQKDRSDVVVRYSDQKDALKRNENQTSHSESFAFKTESDSFLTVELTPDRFLNTPVIIKSIKVYGVSQPKYYKKNDDAR